MKLFSRRTEPRRPEMRDAAARVLRSSCRVHDAASRLVEASKLLELSADQLTQELKRDDGTPPNR